MDQAHTYAEGFPTGPEVVYWFGWRRDSTTVGFRIVMSIYRCTWSTQFWRSETGRLNKYDHQTVQFLIHSTILQAYFLDSWKENENRKGFHTTLDVLYQRKEPANRKRMEQLDHFVKLQKSNIFTTEIIMMPFEFQQSLSFKSSWIIMYWWSGAGQVKERENLLLCVAGSLEVISLIFLLKDLFDSYWESPEWVSDAMYIRFVRKQWHDL